AGVRARASLGGKPPRRSPGAAAGDVPALEPGVRDVFEIAVGVRVVQRAVLAEALDVVGPLHLVEHGEPAPVRAGDHLPVLVEVEAVGVPAALAEEFELVRLRVVAPDALLELDRRWGRAGGRVVAAYV